MIPLDFNYHFYADLRRWWNHGFGPVAAARLAWFALIVINLVYSNSFICLTDNRG